MAGSVVGSVGGRSTRVDGDAVPPARAAVRRSPAGLGVVRRSRRRRRRLLLVVVVLVIAGIAGSFLALRSQVSRPATGCTASGDGLTYRLTLEQAANAATIAAVAHRRGLPNHAVTIALATSLQETKLRNLPFGDLDSVGLFQQRPSQGWGAQQQLLDPAFATGAFYTHLVQVPGWQTLPVAEAAQAVQRSADGSAYSRWEPVARLLARGLTGELPRGLACAFAAGDLSGAPPAQPVDAALANQRGAGTVGQPVAEPVGWATSAWLVANAAQYRVGRVSFAGWTWSSDTGGWTASGQPALVVGYQPLR